MPEYAYVQTRNDRQRVDRSGENRTLGRRDMWRPSRRKQGGGEEPILSGIQVNWPPIGKGVRQCFQPAVPSSLQRHCREKPVRQSGYLVS